MQTAVGNAPNMLLRTCLLWALLCISGAAQAIDVTLEPAVSGREAVIKISGEFQSGDEEKFKAVALGVRHATVVLEGPGGTLRPAMEIGKIIRLKGFATEVRDAVCASACAMAWLAGEPRVMGNFASIGFHSSFNTNDDGTRTAGPANGARVATYLTRLGFSEKIVMFIVSAKPDEMNWLHKSTADRLGIAVSLQSAKAQTEALKDFEEGLRARKGPKPDNALAANYYRRSASTGYAGAQNNLGDLYEAGKGVPKNSKLAVYWYTRAAERGEPTAYLSLASYLSEGSDDPEVLVEAGKFAGLAFSLLPAGRNKEEARGLATSLSAKLSAQDRARVLGLIERWAPLHQEEHLMGDTPFIK
jgi:hypothetical protein